MSQVGNYASTPRMGSVTISTANAARDGTGALGVVFQAGASGSRVEALTIAAQGNTTAGSVRLYIHDGTTARYFTEVAVPLNTATATNPPSSITLSSVLGNAFFPVILPNLYSIRASTTNAEAFNISTTLAGDF